jgi:hypothetical protein
LYGIDLLGAWLRAHREDSRGIYAKLDRGIGLTVGTADQERLEVIGVGKPSEVGDRSLRSNGDSALVYVASDRQEEAGGCFSEPVDGPELVEVRYDPKAILCGGRRRNKRSDRHEGRYDRRPGVP